MSKKTKVITSNIQPNPKEAEIWAKINEDGSREVKQYNSSTGKFECCGGSGNGEKEVYTYIDVKDYSKINRVPYMYAAVLKYEGDLMGTTFKGFLPYDIFSQFNGSIDNVTAIMIDENCYTTNINDESMSVVASFIDILKAGSNSEEYFTLPRITKEEFYNLDA